MRLLSPLYSPRVFRANGAEILNSRRTDFYTVSTLCGYYPRLCSSRVFRARGAKILNSRRTDFYTASTLCGYRAVPEFFAPAARKTCIAAALTSPQRVLYAAIIPYTARFFKNVFDLSLIKWIDERITEG